MASPLSEPPSPHTLTFALCFEHHLRVCQGDAHSVVPTTMVGTRLRTGRDKTSHVVISQVVLQLKKTLLCILSGKDKNHVLILTDPRGPGLVLAEPSILALTLPDYQCTTAAPGFTPGPGAYWLLTKKP